MSRQNFQARRAFSRVDLAVVAAIAVILATVLVMALQRQRERESRQYVRNYVKQVIIAVHSFNDAYRKLPPAFDKCGGMTIPASLHVHLLPYLENEPLWDRYRREGGLEHDKPAIGVFIAQSLRNDAEERGVQNNAANLRVFSDKGVATPFDGHMPALAEVEPGNGKLTGTITDGTSNTIFFATKYAYCAAGGSQFTAAPNSPFAAFFGQNAASVKAHPSDPGATFQLMPSDPECLTSPLMAQSFDRIGITVGMADGSVRQVAPDITPYTWNSAVQPNDGNALGTDW